MPGNDIRLLALDGGGVRGLSALVILEKLMEAVYPNAPPRPCDYFDMIGGTSTGGLIAIMLGRLRMSVAECIVVYLSLSARVFRKTRHRVTARGKLRGRFDSEELVRAEQMYEQALQGGQEAFGPTHSSTLQAANNLGVLYEEQGKLEEAEQMYERALQGKEKAYGLAHPSTLQTFQNLGCLYKSQGKLDKAEQMFERTLRGHEEIIGSDQVHRYIPALKTLENMGNLHLKQGEYFKAEIAPTRALEGHYAVPGHSEKRCAHLVKTLDALREFLSEPEQPEYQESWALASEAFKLEYNERKKSSNMSIQEVVAASEGAVLQRNEKNEENEDVDTGASQQHILKVPFAFCVSNS